VISQPPEAVLIRRAREAQAPRMSIKTAAKTCGAVSAETWGYVERGYRPASGGNGGRAFVASPRILAHMAHTVQIGPEELDAVGREDAGTVLREIISRRSACEPDREPQPNIDFLNLVADFFENAAVPDAEKMITAEWLFRRLPYYLTGQPPPTGAAAGTQPGRA
jgi:hypothetical protein